jgi:hypothetical protein
MLVSGRVDKIFLLMLILTCSTWYCAHAQGTSLDAANDVDLGYGWDSALGTKSGGGAVCIDFQPHLGQSSRRWATVGQLEDTNDLYQELGITTQAKLKALFGSGEAKAKFVSQHKVHSEIFILGVHAVVENSADYVAPRSDQIQGVSVTNLLSTASNVGLSAIAPQALNGAIASQLASAVGLKKEYRDLAITDPDGFQRTCGDSYVASIVKGAELAGTVVITGLSAHDQQSVEENFSGNAFGQSASGDVSTIVQNTTTNHTTSVDFQQSGGWGGNLSTGKDEMLAAIRALPDAAANAPWPFRMEVISYDKLSNWPSGQIHRDATPLSEILNRYARLRSILDQILYVDSQKSDYIFEWGVNEPVWTEVITTLRHQLSTLQEQATDCNEGRKCPTLAETNQYLEFPFLTKIPVKKHSFSADDSLRADSATLQSTINKFNADKAQARFQVALIPVAPNWGRGIARLQATDRWNRNVNPIVTQFVREFQAYPAALQEAVSDQRLRKVWRRFCGLNVSDPECVDPDRLQSFSTQIPISGRPISLDTDPPGRPYDDLDSDFVLHYEIN